MVQCSNRNEWRTWLAQNHALYSEAWLVYFKKHTGKPSIAYRESVEEALCFGWIDGLKRRIDDERYVHRFTPRKAKSRWSPLNISLAEQLIAEGKMTDTGLKAYQQRISYDEDFLETKAQSELTVPEEFRTALGANPEAEKNFLAMAPGYRKQYIAWVSSAKRDETRKKRLAEAIRMLELNKKPGMK